MASVAACAARTLATATRTTVQSALANANRLPSAPARKPWRIRRHRPVATAPGRAGLLRRGSASAPGTQGPSRGSGHCPTLGARHPSCQHQRPCSLVASAYANQSPERRGPLPSFNGHCKRLGNGRRRHSLLWSSVYSQKKQSIMERRRVRVSLWSIVM